MKDLEFNEADFQKMRQLGLTGAQVRQQIGCFLKPYPWFINSFFMKLRMW